MRLGLAAVVAGSCVVVSGDFRRVLLSSSSRVITDPLFYAAAIPAVTLLGLAKGGFSGWFALECMVTGDPHDTLPRCVRFLRDCWSRAEEKAHA